VFKIPSDKTVFSMAHPSAYFSAVEKEINFVTCNFGLALSLNGIRK
jgi:hypothetical protein